jgi:ABC-type sugar transport system ATPase subunit
LVFLMDEPLSNLDAKLRVQMRAEVARIQRHLGVSTIYVTHDQVEAMTMGDRVIVMRDGTLQQVDTRTHPDPYAGLADDQLSPNRARQHRTPNRSR